MGGRAREWLVAAALVCCLLVLAVWQTAAFLSSRQAPPLQITASDFDGFRPSLGGWNIEPIPVGSDPLEPNILVFRLSPAGVRTNGAVIFRLVHGYNMRDCLRIKGYNVELIGDAEAAGIAGAPGISGRLQSWRVIGSDGHVSVWCTRMIRAYDLAPTGDSVTSMAFPRVGTPDDPNWAPRGLTLKSLRHPVRNFLRLLRSKWNSSRCDPLTFLGLKRPAWTSDELLTVVGASVGPSVQPQNEPQELGTVSEAMDSVFAALLKWRSGR